jgi:hypothetical protein
VETLVVVMVAQAEQL